MQRNTNQGGGIIGDVVGMLGLGHGEMKKPRKPRKPRAKKGGGIIGDVVGMLGLGHGGMQQGGGFGDDLLNIANKGVNLMSGKLNSGIGEMLMGLGRRINELHENQNALLGHISKQNKIMQKLANAEIRQVDDQAPEEVKIKTIRKTAKKVKANPLLKEMMVKQLADQIMEQPKRRRAVVLKQPQNVAQNDSNAFKRLANLQIRHTDANALNGGSAQAKYNFGSNDYIAGQTRIAGDEYMGGRTTIAGDDEIGGEDYIAGKRKRGPYKKKVKGGGFFGQQLMNALVPQDTNLGKVANIFGALTMPI